MKIKRFMCIISVVAVLVAALVIPAAAASSDIYIGATRNSSSGDAWAKCYASGTTSTMVTGAVYKNNSRVKYISGSGTNYGYADFAGVSNDSMKVSSSARTNGTYYTGPSKWY